jgi:xylulokinase
LGAARLGWLASGAALTDVCQPSQVLHTLTPSATQAAWMAERHDRFCALYPALHAQR